ncbi:hypothetical protein [Bradyrhizobium sp.]|uniref:hypothetical protein n=1 Tax=Bradyrhizobium sp. TaxID=376 RepID=UPI003C504903
MLDYKKVIAAAVLSLAAVIPASLASAADLPVNTVKAKPKPPADLPFFLIIDDRVTFSYMPSGTSPDGAYIKNPNGSYSGSFAKQVYSFTHFDAWAYGTNFFAVNMFKGDHNDPAAPCTNPGSIGFVATPGANCAGETEFYALIRSTFGFNEIFDTKAFTWGPLRNVSLEVGAAAGSLDTGLASADRAFVGGLQFAFDLPYKGYVDVAPMVLKEMGHAAYLQCGDAANPLPGVNCLWDGNLDYDTTWTVETNWYMDLGFLPENWQYFAIGGRAAWIGPKGNQNAPLGPAGGGTPTVVEFNSEPIRLTFDASKAIWGNKYSHIVDTWIAYRYWQNKFGLDHTAAPGVCTVNGVSTGSCTEKTVYAGITVKF